MGSPNRTLIKWTLKLIGHWPSIGTVCGVSMCVLYTKKHHSSCHAILQSVLLPLQIPALASCAYGISHSPSLPSYLTAHSNSAHYKVNIKVGR